MPATEGVLLSLPPLFFKKKKPTTKAALFLTPTPDFKVSHSLTMENSNAITVCSCFSPYRASWLKVVSTVLLLEEKALSPRWKNLFTRLSPTIFLSSAQPGFLSGAAVDDQVPGPLWALHHFCSGILIGHLNTPLGIHQSKGAFFSYRPLYLSASLTYLQTNAFHCCWVYLLSFALYQVWFWNIMEENALIHYFNF